MSWAAGGYDSNSCQSLSDSSAEEHSEDARESSFFVPPKSSGGHSAPEFVKGSVVVSDGRNNLSGRRVIDASAELPSSDDEEDEKKPPVEPAAPPPVRDFYQELQAKVAKRQQAELGVPAAYERLYGKGFAMLKRMGFDEDLADRPAPLQVKPRKARQGLQERGERPLERSATEVAFDPVRELKQRRRRQSAAAAAPSNNNRWKRGHEQPRPARPAMHTFSDEVLARLRDQRSQARLNADPVEETLPPPSLSSSDDEADVRETRRRQQLIRKMKEAQAVLKTTSTAAAAPLRIVDMTLPNAPVISSETLATKLSEARRATVVEAPEIRRRAAWEDESEETEEMEETEKTGAMDKREVLRSLRTKLERAVASADEELANAAYKRAAQENAAQRLSSQRSRWLESLAEKEARLRLLQPASKLLTVWCESDGLQKALAVAKRGTAPPPLPPPDALLLETETLFADFLEREPQAYVELGLADLVLAFAKVVVRYADLANETLDCHWDLSALSGGLAQLREACWCSIRSSSDEMGGGAGANAGNNAGNAGDREWEALLSDVAARSLKKRLLKMEVDLKPSREVLQGVWLEAERLAGSESLLREFFFPKILERVEALLQRRAAGLAGELLENWVAATPSRFRAGYLGVAVRSAHWLISSGRL